MAKVTIGDITLAESAKVVEVEGTRYFPPDSVRKDLLTEGDRQYTCPWKGKSTYWDIHIGDKVYSNAAWSYEQPKPAAKQITRHVAFDRTVVSIED
ncbi:MAG: DUF427 domain-containing protein [Dehalococcoidia bacterium]|nr:DUF427 domain-containing protein [Dehalococcoidia bacterium]